MVGTVWPVRRAQSLTLCRHGENESDERLDSVVWGNVNGLGRGVPRFESKAKRSRSDRPEPRLTWYWLSRLDPADEYPGYGVESFLLLFPGRVPLPRQALERSVLGP